MGISQYILDEDGNPKRERDDLKWAMWFEYSHRSKGKDNRILAQDHIGSVRVSTVFLGLDHAFPPNPKKPVLWETMIFGGEHDDWMRRYCTRAEAIIGHNEAVEMVKASQLDLRELERMAEAGGWRKK